MTQSFLLLILPTRLLIQSCLGTFSPFLHFSNQSYDRPDKCGGNNKVHFIFRHQSPKTGEFEEKHLSSAPASGVVDKKTTLYTLVVRPDQSFEISINNKSVKKGSLLEDFTPSVNPPKEIDDPKETKPEDWVDEAKIVDPEATKPEDWDEEAPREILDESAAVCIDKWSLFTLCRFLKIGLLMNPTPFLILMLKSLKVNSWAINWLISI